MKLKADSLIVSAYGREFYNNHVIWFPESSAFYNGKYAGATWYDYEEWKPKEFLLRYSIQMSEEEIYDDQIEIHLDSIGRIRSPNDGTPSVEGLEKTTVKRFKLTRALAIEKAKKMGLVETDSAKAFTFLKWQFDQTTGSEIFNGHFTYKVGINTQAIIHKPRQGRNSVEYKYTVYTFNPWTSEFINQEKMKSFREWEQVSGMSTGLMPDN